MKFKIKSIMQNKTKIKIPDPIWSSNLANIILDLEKLRSKKLYSKVPPYVFYQLKEIFQILETLGSARIEGNNTTLSEYVENIIEGEMKKKEEQEISNLDEAIDYIEKNVTQETIFSEDFIFNLHRIVTKGLIAPPKGEGSNTPGKLREVNVEIRGSLHNPPNCAAIHYFFKEFLDFINYPFAEQYQLLMVAIAHHRFAYIHPFDNANGRMGRLLNYALLIRLGFRVKEGRIINPSAIFYINRDKYYDMLGKADSLKDDDVLEWAEYFLLGLKNEIEKIDNLLNIEYVREEILLPAFKFALSRENITEQEFKILKYVIYKEGMTIKSEELSNFGITKSVQKARTMEKLKNKKMVSSIREGGRIYKISFANNYLLRGVMNSLGEQGFVSDFLNKR